MWLISDLILYPKWLDYHKYHLMHSVIIYVYVVHLHYNTKVLRL